MSMVDWETEKALRADVERELAKVRAELVDARTHGLTAAGVDAMRLDGVVRDAVMLVRFAVGNLPPESTPGWPVTQLKNVIAGLPALPSYGIDDATLKTELDAFVREIESNNGRRAIRREEAPAPAA